MMKKGTSNSVLQGDYVVQEASASLLFDQPVDGDLVNGTAPLIRFKLTLFLEGTFIGLTWNHALGQYS